jgi:hypothetical protein
MGKKIAWVLVRVVVLLASWYDLKSFVIKEATSATCKELCWKILLLRSFQIFHKNTK